MTSLSSEINRARKKLEYRAIRERAEAHPLKYLPLADHRRLDEIEFIALWRWYQTPGVKPNLREEAVVRHALKRGEQVFGERLGELMNLAESKGPSQPG
jgi:hypothetical protein